MRVSARCRQFLDGLALPVPAEEIHPSVRAPGVAPQHLVDETHGFDVLLPVERGAKAKTRHGIRDRDLGDPLTLVFATNRIFRGRLCRREVFLDRRAEGRKALVRLRRLRRIAASAWSANRVRRSAGALPARSRARMAGGGLAPSRIPPSVALDGDATPSHAAASACDNRS